MKKKRKSNNCEATNKRARNADVLSCFESYGEVLQLRHVIINE